MGARKADPGEGQGSLFDVTPVERSTRQGTGEPERKAPRARAKLVERPTWSKLNGRRVPCDEGVRFTYEAEKGASRGGVPHLDHARYKREFSGEVHRMCYHCALHWREADGYDGLPS